MSVFTKNNNGKLKKTKRKGETFLVFSLPAGETCPHADACRDGCYACSGHYLLPDSKRVREFNLELSKKIFFLEYLDMSLREAWKGKGKCYVRIHDSGDFYSAEYLNDWIQFAKMHPEVTFYAYTKSVSMVKAAGELPANLVIAFSYGGDEDALIQETDRQVKVFKDKASIPDGWVDGTLDDHVVIENMRTALAYHGQKRWDKAGFSEVA